VSRDVKINPTIETTINSMLKEATTFEEKKWAVETAMKFEALKIKAKTDKTGKFFTGGDDDGDDEF
jgi:hypothetical protein